MPKLKYKIGEHKTCSVVNCKNTQKKINAWRNKEICQQEGVLRKYCRCCVPPYQMHRFPEDRENRNKWIQQIGENASLVNVNDVRDYHRICSVHFIDGFPTSDHPYPTLHMGYDLDQPSSRLSSERPAPKECCIQENVKEDIKMAEEQIEKVQNNNTEEQNNNTEVQNNNTEEQNNSTTEVQNINSTEEQNNNSTEEQNNNTEEQNNNTEEQNNNTEEQNNNTEEQNNNTEEQNNKAEKRFEHISTQCYYSQPVSHDHSYFATTSDKSTQTEVQPSISTEELNDTQFHFFTGISSLVFLGLLKSVLNWASASFQIPSHRLPIKEQLLLVLMRLRLGLLLPDLAYRFKVSTSTACKVFGDWVVLLGKYSRANLVYWLPRDTILRIRPKCFSTNFHKVTCILDCTEIFTQRPKDLMKRAQTYSNYKNHNTYKALYCIAPDGFVMFISKLFGGRASDGFITQHCNITDYFLSGDQVMVDRGFTISGLLPPNVELVIPEFTRNYKDGILPEESVAEGRRISNVRIHVERAIRRLKCFRFLSNIIPGNVKNVDDILYICAGLCNTQPPLINEEGIIEYEECDLDL